jgi:hypothetical protein
MPKVFRGATEHLLAFFKRLSLQTGGPEATVRDAMCVCVMLYCWPAFQALCATRARARTHTHTRTHAHIHTHTHTHTQDSKGTTDHGPVHVATQERRGADGPSSQAPHRHTLRSLTSAASCVRLDGDRIQENSPLQRWCGGGCQRGGERKQRWPRDGDRCTSTLRANQLGKLRWTVRSTSLYSFTPFWFMRRALRERVGCGFMSEPSTLFHP